MGLGPSMPCVWLWRPHGSYMSLGWYCATEFETRVLVPSAWGCVRIGERICDMPTVPVTFTGNLFMPQTLTYSSQNYFDLCVKTLLQFFVLTFWRGQSLLFSPKLLSPCLPFVVAHLSHCFCDHVFLWFCGFVSSTRHLVSNLLEWMNEYLEHNRPRNVYFLTCFPGQEFRSSIGALLWSSDSSSLMRLLWKHQLWLK